MSFRTKANFNNQSQTTCTATLNIDVGSGNNRIVMVGVATSDATTSPGGNQDPTDVTVNGVSCTKAIAVETTDYDGYGQTSIWYMLDSDLPASTGNYSVTATFASASSEIWVHASLYDDLAQQAPEATARSWVEASETATPSTNITTVSSNAMIFGFGGFQYAPSGTLSAGASYTLLNADAGSYSHNLFPPRVGTYADEYDLDAGTAGVKTVDLSSETGWWQMLAVAFEIGAAGSPPPAGGPNMDAAIMMGVVF